MDFTNFIESCLQFGSELSADSRDVAAAYVEFNNGITTGKLKLYAHLATLPGINKIKTIWRGIGLKQVAPIVAQVAPIVAQVAPIVAEPVAPIVAQVAPIVAEPVAPIVAEPVAPIVAEPVAEPVADHGLSVYEQQMIDLKREKLKISTELKMHEMNELKQMKKEKLKATKEHSELLISTKREKIDNDFKVAVMKIESRERCLEKSFEFQREGNNRNRYLTVGTINIKNDYKIIGTATCPQIEYNSLIEKIDASEYSVDYKEPLKDCILERKSECLMIDETKEQAIDINTYISIVKLLVSKFETDEISESLKDEIIDIFAEDEEYKNEIDTINDIVIDENFREHNVKLGKSEIKDLQDIKQNIYRNSRYHTKAHERYMSETKKISGKRSMYDYEDYIREENNIRYDAKNRSIIDCYCCSKELKLKDAQRSHVIAKIHGGTCDKDNIRLCCKTCNLHMKTGDLYLYKESLCSEL